jgi:nitroreductase
MAGRRRDKSVDAVPPRNCALDAEHHDPYFKSSSSTFSTFMNPIALIETRRSIREFTSREVTRAEIETLLNAAVLAPNHRLTQPWRFYVLGEEARRGLGLALGNRKARKVEDPAAADAVRQKTAAEHVALPLMIAVAIVVDENPEIHGEDYAAGMMAVQNISLAAVELGLGTHIKTGAVMEDPAARAAMGVAETERVIAMLNVGEPASTPPAKVRRSAASLTTWLP